MQPSLMRLAQPGPTGCVGQISEFVVEVFIDQEGEGPRFCRGAPSSKAGLLLHMGASAPVAPGLDTWQETTGRNRSTGASGTVGGGYVEERVVGVVRGETSAPEAWGRSCRVAGGRQHDDGEHDQGENPDRQSQFFKLRHCVHVRRTFASLPACRSPT